MTRIGKTGAGWAVWAALSVFACGQGPGTRGAGAKAAPPRVPPSAALQPEPPIPGHIFREIDDPSSGDCWLLERDATDPGGPGRLVREERHARYPVGQSGQPGAGSTLGPAAQQETRQRADRSAARLPVIHAGQRLIVEENTPVVEARLEAVALNPAAMGSVFKVRLAIGGKVVRAVAEGPGRAALVEEIGAQP